MGSLWKFLLFFTLCALSHYAERASISKQLNNLQVTSCYPIKSPGQGGITGTPFDDVSALNQSGMSPIVGVHSINISMEISSKLLK